MTRALTTRSNRQTLSSSEPGAAKYAKASKAANTQRAYRAAWNEFTAWAAGRGARALPAEASTVVDYLGSLADAGARVSTISVKRAAISFAHRTAGEADPTSAEAVRMVMAGISRKLGRAAQKKAPVTLDDLRAVMAALPADSLAGQRDRALLLVGWAGAFRRSELVALDVADLRLGAELTVAVRRSKTDQEGRGMLKVIPALEEKDLCPVTALRGWLNAAQIKSGPVFRRIDRWGHMRAERLTAQSVALVVKAACQAAGLDARAFSGHSLRAGYVTAAAQGGADALEIAEQTGHKSLEVLRGYIRDTGRLSRRATLAAFGRAGHEAHD